MMNIPVFIIKMNYARLAYLSILCIVFPYLVAGGNTEKYIYFFKHSSWLGLMLVFGYEQLLQHEIYLYSDRIVIKRTMLLRWMMHEYKLQDLTSITFYSFAQSSVCPFIKVKCENCKKKKREFGFLGSKKKMREMLELLKEMKVNAEEVPPLVYS